MFGAEWKGVISDKGCGAKHGPGKENVGCVTKCLGNGSAPVFVTADGKVITIHNADKITKEMWGKSVTITGKLDGDTVHIDSVTM
jgi:hypothetical protein